MKDFFNLPANLPVPQDDGACDHLRNQRLPGIKLQSTSGAEVNLAVLAQSPTVVFFYPRTGHPLDADPSLDGWDAIPGARGCTPQACGFRDLKAEFTALGCDIVGLSTQTTEYQQEFVERMRITFDILSDASFALTDALALPTFVYRGERLLKRMSWVLGEGCIKKVFYPVFPSGQNAATVLDWLSGRGQRDALTKRNRIEPSRVEEARGSQLLSNDKARLDVETVASFLARSHWAARRSRALIERSLPHSDCYGVYEGSRQLAFARVVTDYATFAYLCDVYVDEEVRGQGLSKWIMEAIMRNPDYGNLRRFMLATKDAHGLYAKYGFTPLSASEVARFMEILKQDV
jgi:peroxiredoxin/GNAT superfamily N-acetyltransferase